MSFPTSPLYEVPVSSTPVCRRRWLLHFGRRTHQRALDHLYGLVFVESMCRCAMKREKSMEEKRNEAGGQNNGPTARSISGSATRRPPSPPLCRARIGTRRLRVVGGGAPTGAADLGVRLLRGRPRCYFLDP